MKTHLSERQIKKYISHTTPPSELLEIDDHLAACDECAKKMAETQDLVTAGFQRSLFSDGSKEHLGYEQVSGYIDGDLDEADRASVEAHRARCSLCDEDIEALLSLRESLAAEPVRSKTQGDVPTASWHERIASSLFLRIAVPAAALLIVIAFVWMAERRPSNELLPHAQTVPANALLGQDMDDRLRPSGASLSDQSESTLPSEGTKAIASLNDGGGKIELDSTGKVSGLSATEFEQKVRAALKDETIEFPSDLRGLKTSARVLMGSSDSGVPFKLNGPVGKVIEPQRPTLSWQPLKDATSYKVGIYDENFNQVAVSPEIHTTSWTPSTPLERGAVYQWQVTATRNGEEVKSPVRPAPEAKFKIVSQSRFADIEKAMRSAGNSHLLLGIVYANAGLLDDAEREFQILLKNNPNSDIAKKLLAKVRSAK